MQVATRGVELEQRVQRRISWRLRIFMGVLVILEAFAYGVPTVGKLERELGRIGLPEGTKIVGSEVNGNVICFDECTSLKQEYLVPGTVDDQDIAGILEARGYAAYLREPGGWEGNQAYSKRFRLGWSVGESLGDRTELEVYIRFA